MQILISKLRKLGAVYITQTLKCIGNIIWTETRKPKFTLKHGCSSRTQWPTSQEISSYLAFWCREKLVAT
jgi:hypothetical protein